MVKIASKHLIEDIKVLSICFYKSLEAKLGFLIPLVMFAFSLIELILRFKYGIELIAKELALTPENIWGILTYGLIHADFSHLIENFIGFIVLSIMLSIILAIAFLSTPKKERTLKLIILGKIYSHIVILGYFPAGLVSYAFVVLGILKEPVVGASGITYAIIGYFIVAIMFMFNRGLAKLKTNIRITIIVIVGFIVISILAQDIIESIGGNINYIAHLTSLCLGITYSITRICKIEEA